MCPLATEALGEMSSHIPRRPCLFIIGCGGRPIPGTNSPADMTRKYLVGRPLGLCGQRLGLQLTCILAGRLVIPQERGNL